MKIRYGFVSNSSSSSFVCEACNSTSVVFDGSLEDAGVVQCVNEHRFCEGHLPVDLHSDKMKEVMMEESRMESCTKNPLTLSEVLEKMENCNFERTHVPASMCPICNKTIVPDGVLLDYLIQRTGMTREELENEYRER